MILSSSLRKTLQHLNLTIVLNLTIIALPRSRHRKIAKILSLFADFRKKHTFLAQPASQPVSMPYLRVECTVLGASSPITTGRYEGNGDLSQERLSQNRTNSLIPMHLLMMIENTHHAREPLRCSSLHTYAGNVRPFATGGNSLHTCPTFSNIHTIQAFVEFHGDSFLPQDTEPRVKCSFLPPKMFSVGKKLMIRVLLADSSRIHTRLLADALRSNGVLEVISFESAPSELLNAVITHEIDILVVSSKLYEQPGRGIEALRELRAGSQKARAVLLLDSSEDDAVLEAFRAGARGVFDKNEPLELLSKCIQCVYQGQIWVNTHNLEVILEALANSPIVRATNAEGMSLLSERELQVVCCLAEGLTNRQIAERLKLSQHTVKNYLFRVFEKLGVSSRFELLSMTLSRSSSRASLAEREQGKRLFAGRIQTD